MNSTQKSLVLKELGDLSRLGLAQQKNGEEIIFENSHIKISIDYFKSGDEKSFLISIKKKGENSSYFFHEYLDFIDHGDYKNLKGEDDYKYISRHLKLFLQFLNGDLKKVVEGKHWIVVPRDYGSYK